MSADAGKALERAISANFVTFQGVVEVETTESTPWTSLTFTGARHRLRVKLEGIGAVGAAADFLGRLAELNLAVPGGIVADIALLSEERRDDGRYACLDLEALTIEGE